MWRKKIKDRLTVKLFLFTAALLLITSMLTYGLVSLFLPRTYEATLSDDLMGKANALAAAASTAPDEESMDALLRQFTRDTSATLSLVRMKTGDATTYIGGEKVDGLPAGEEEVGADETAESTSLFLGFEWIATGESYGISITGSMEEVGRAQAALAKILPWLFVAVLAVSVLGAIVYARYVTRPIVRLSEVSKRFAALDFDWQANTQRTDEIGVLAQNLSLLAQRLSAALEELESANARLRQDVAREKELQQQRTQFFRSVSHELKTPLTILKAQLEGMLDNVGIYQDRDKYLGRALEVASSMEDMVRDILSIARTEDGCHEVIERQLVDLSTLLRENVDAYQELLLAKGMTIELDIPPALMAETDPSMLGTVLANLLGNAVQHSPENSTIYLCAKQLADAACIEIENTGVQIPEALIGHLFEPFFRVDPSRNRQTGGSGLGLYIVKTMLDSLGAAYTIENTERGVRFTLTLPT